MRAGEPGEPAVTLVDTLPVPAVGAPLPLVCEPVPAAAVIGVMPAAFPLRQPELNAAQQRITVPKTYALFIAETLVRK
jgi:hypothetical protein